MKEQYDLCPEVLKDLGFIMDFHIFLKCWLRLKPSLYAFRKSFMWSREGSRGRYLPLKLSSELR